MKNTVTHSRILLRGILVFSLILNTHSTFAQKKTKKKDKEKTEAAVKKDGFKKISELTKNSSEFPGLFTVYQDSTSGDIKIAVSKDQIGKEYIYFSQIADGVTEVRGFRGNYKGSKVIKIEKYYNKIEFIQVNTSSYFDP